MTMKKRNSISCKKKKPRMTFIFITGGIGSLERTHICTTHSVRRKNRRTNPARTIIFRKTMVIQNSFPNEFPGAALENETNPLKTQGKSQKKGTELDNLTKKALKSTHAAMRSS